jgi:hypothetical protein
MESNQQVIRPVPPQIGSPAGERRDSNFWITRYSDAAES